MTRRAAWLLFVVPVLAGCECRRPGPVEPIALGLRVQPSELEFGRVLEGALAVQTVTLTSVTRAPITVQLETGAPFEVASPAEVPGGGDVAVPVTFRAGNTEVEGVLRLTVGDRSAELRLHGIGVRPPDCRPSAACVVSVYSLEEDRCLESQSPDDAPCDTASVCLEQGRCRAGQCLGIARRCDDNNLCTDDACAMEVGCIHTPHACPAPTGVCRVATCDALSGCGAGPAPDLTACGPQDCVEVNFCFGGACQKQPTPEGLVCAPAIACLPEAECHNQVCTRPSEATWMPSWSARISGEPSGGLASSGSTLFFSVCVDAGVMDAGAIDAGALDGGPLEPQPVPWRPTCSLASYTGTGFERYARDGGMQPHDFVGGAPRSVLAVSSAGVLLARDGGLELRSQVTGALRHELDVTPARPLLVVEPERVLFWADGGVQAWVDGGLTLLAAVEQPMAMGRGLALFTWNPDAGLLTRLQWLVDGGVERQELATTGIDSGTLAVAGNFATFGGAGRAALDGVSDGGLVLFDWNSTEVSRFLDEQTLSSAAATDVFFLRCDGGCGGPGQETYVRVFDTVSGAERWQAAVVTPAFPGEIVTTTLVDGSPGSFVAVLRSETALGPRALAALFAEGERKVVCRLPDVSGAIEQAHFSATALVVTVRRADGTVALESYEFGALPISRSTWATPQGVNGTRSDRP